MDSITFLDRMNVKLKEMLLLLLYLILTITVSVAAIVGVGWTRGGYEERLLSYFVVWGSVAAATYFSIYLLASNIRKHHQKRMNRKSIVDDE